MPRIGLIPEVYYQPLNPYHHYYDNLPLKNIQARNEIINAAVDNNSATLREAAGNQGSISNRLNQSLEEDGSIKSDAIDAAEHHIGAHEEGLFEGVEYVIMTQEERDKLSLIADEATHLSIQIETPSTTTLFDAGTIEFESSDTISWEVISPNRVKAEMAFPVSAAHVHYYDLTPAHSNLITPDYINFKTTSVATPFVEDSLRVFVNGIRIPASPDSVYVYDTEPDNTWALTNFVPNHSAGTFALNRAIDEDDVIKVDFDTDFS